MSNQKVKPKQETTLFDYLTIRLGEILDNNPDLVSNLQSFENFLITAGKFLSHPQVVDFLTKLPDLDKKRAIAVNEMSSKGWFPNKYCLFNYPSEGQSIDDFMIMLTETKYESIKIDILSRYHERFKILENAFNLYEEKNYIACIPLFLTQIDGICFDSGLNHYFTNNYSGKSITNKNKPEFKKFPIYVKSLLNQSSISDRHKEFFNAIVDKADKAFISLGTQKIDEINELTILNRHGILHGLQGFSGYGTKINAQKILSLICYISLMVDLLEDVQRFD